MNESVVKMRHKFLDQIVKRFTAKCWQQVWSPVYAMAYYQGLSCGYIKYDHRSESYILKITSFGYINCLVHFIVYNICYIYTIRNNFESIVGYFIRSDISYVCDVLQILCGYVGAVCVYMNILIPKKNLMGCFQRLTNMDSMLEEVGVQVKFTKMLYCLYKVVFTLCFTNVAYSFMAFMFLHSAKVKPSWALIIIFILQHAAIMCRNLQFVCTAFCIKSRCSMINQYSDMTNWREFLNPVDNYDATQSMLLVTFLLGITPFRLQGPRRHRRIQVSRFGYMNTLLQLLFFMYCYIHALAMEESIVGYFFKSEISKVGDTLQKFIGMWGMLTLFGISLGECRKLIRLYNAVALVDRKFLDLGVSFNYRHIMHMTLWKLFILIVLNVTYMGSSFWLLFRNNIWPTLQAMVSFFVPHLFLLSVVVLYTAYAMRLHQHHHLLNKVLKNLQNELENQNNKPKSLSAVGKRKSKEPFSIYPVVAKTPSQVVQESMEIHQLICRAADDANKYFTYQLLTIISIAFLIIVFDAYYVLETLLGKSNRESKFNTAEFVAFFSCQMVLYLIAIVSIVEASHKAMNKSEKTSIIVHALLANAKDAELKEKLQHFSLQLLHLKVKFTAGGLFTIHRPLYFTICGALTTYLIILLQFTTNTPQCCGQPSMSENTQNNNNNSNNMNITHNINFS